MRICVMGHGLTPVSGHARGITEVAAMLEKRGVRVDFFTDALDDSAKQLWQSLSQRHGISFHLYELGEKETFESFLKNPIFEESLRNSDLAHVFDVPSLFFVRKAIELKKIKLKILYSVATFPKFDFKSLCSGPYVWLRIFDWHDKNFLIGFLFPKLLLPWIYSRADHILTSCDALRKYLWNVGVSKEKVSVIYPPVNSEIFKPEKARKRTGTFRIFYYGWVSDIRGVSDVLEAFKAFNRRIPDSALIISNPDAHLSPETRVLRRRIQKAGKVYPVQFLNYQLDIQQCLADADLVLLPFRGRFGYLHPPMTLIETILKEKVVLTRPLESILEIVQEKKLLVSESESLEQRVVEVYKNYEEYQRSVVTCREKMVKILDFEAVVHEYVTLYEKISFREARYLAREVYSDAEVAKTYDAVRFSSLGGKLFDRIEKKVLLKHIPQSFNSQILEVGSGTGRFLIALGQKGYARLCAMDISEPLLQIVRQNAAKLKINVQTVLGDIYNLPYSQDTFDAVYALRVLNQLGADEHRIQAIRQLVRLVKPGGSLIFDVINRSSLAWFKDPDQHTDLICFKKGISCMPGMKVVRVLHRMSLSQTLMEKSPGFLAWCVYGLDLLFSSVFPFWGTRVYFILQKSKGSD